jgi:hypothetical protein
MKAGDQARVCSVIIEPEMLRLQWCLRIPPTVPHLIRSRTFLSAANAGAFKSLSEEDIAHFAEILPKSSILSTLSPFHASADDLNVYNNDWMGKYSGSSQCVLKPKTVEEVSRILKWCNEHNIAVVPQGGNTGLVGALIRPDVTFEQYA